MEEARRFRSAKTRKAIGTILISAGGLVGTTVGVLSWLEISKEQVYLSLSGYLVGKVEIPNIFIMAVLIASFAYIFLSHRKNKKRFSDKYYQNSIAMSGFSSQLKSSPVDQSICGIYLGIRPEAAGDERKYFIQYLTICKMADNDYRFLLYDNYEEKEWFIEGACIKVQGNLVLKGAIDCNYDAVHSLFLQYPVHEMSTELEGIIVLTRLKKSAAVATKVKFHKIYNVTEVGSFPRDVFKSSLLGEKEFQLAKSYREDELTTLFEHMKFSGLNKDKLMKSKGYVDSAYNVPTLLHS